MKKEFIVVLLVNIILSTMCTFLTDKSSSSSERMKVTLRVFSGTEDPFWFIEVDQINRLNQLLILNKFEAISSTRVMGYRCFEISYENSNSISNISGAPTAELFLLTTGQNLISMSVQNHVLEQISVGYQLKKTQTKLQIELKEVAHKKTDIDCDKTPITGSNEIPIYDPESDNGGCYVEKQWDNNCYNYGTDIVTNTFAQPGRGTGHKWVENTCDDVKRAALSDGLQYVGVEYPSIKPEMGHFVALLIWPGTNFHWIRLDSSEKWSHKPGGSNVRNTDNNEKEINDPSSQDFSPWSEFCGYYLVIPSEANIN